VQALIGRLDVDLLLENGLLRVAVAECHDLVHVAKEHLAKHARGQQVVEDPVVDRTLGPFDRIE
jgi:hypothetical protein